MGENSFGVRRSASGLAAAGGSPSSARPVDTDALATDLEALALAHPEIAGTLHLAATTLAEQKA